MDTVNFSINASPEVIIIDDDLEETFDVGETIESELVCGLVSQYAEIMMTCFGEVSSTDESSDKEEENETPVYDDISPSVNIIDRIAAFAQNLRAPAPQYRSTDTSTTVPPSTTNVACQTDFSQSDILVQILEELRALRGL